MTDAPPYGAAIDQVWTVGEIVIDLSIRSPKPFPPELFMDLGKAIRAIGDFVAELDDQQNYGARPLRLEPLKDEEEDVERTLS